VCVWKRLVEIQYFRATITNEQREEFGQLVDETLRRIESAQFLPQSGVRFRKTPVLSCLHTWASAWSDRNESTPLCYAVRETLLVCLTNLRASHPPMLPKLNKNALCSC
jgi:hypothetical protein